MTHHSITTKQRELLDKDLEAIMQRLSDITILLNMCYGSKSPVSASLEEAHAALQRLSWALRQRSSPPFRVHRHSLRPTDEGTEYKGPPAA